MAIVEHVNLPAVAEQDGRASYKVATNAATLCGDIVKATAQTIQGRKYVKVEGWLAIAAAHGCLVSIREVENVEGGIRAVAEIRRISDQALLATAEGFVGDDEPTWAKRPMFARRAMAQTRASSRVCRSAFAHVVVLIDKHLGTTPAEEMQGAIEHENPNSPGAALAQAANEIAAQTGESRSNYDIKKEEKARKALLETARGAMQMCTIRQMLAEWWNENKAELREKLSEDDFAAIKTEVAAKRDQLPALAA